MNVMKKIFLSITIIAFNCIYGQTTKQKTVAPAKVKEITIDIPNMEGGMEGIMLAANTTIFATTWNDANIKCESLAFGSNGGGTPKFDDWRLPTKEEVCLIYDYYKKNPKYFKAGSEYWTNQVSTRRAGYYFSAQFFGMDLPCSVIQNDGTSKFEVMPVRNYSKIGD
jgi:hypothetical protein